MCQRQVKHVGVGGAEGAEGSGGAARGGVRRCERVWEGGVRRGKVWGGVGRCGKAREGGGRRGKVWEGVGSWGQAKESGAGKRWGEGRGEEVELEGVPAI